MRFPSVTGEGVQGGLSSAVTSFSVHVIPDCQSNFPVRRSKHKTSRLLLMRMACVTKTRSRHSAGVELPRSGSGTRQHTFSFVLQWSGRFFSVAMPLPSGPRHPGQFAAVARAANAIQAQIKRP